MSKSKISNSDTPKEPVVSTTKVTGTLVIISSPSGGGKTTVVERLLKRHPDWVRSISVTTREPREGEKKGEDYYFVTESAFKKMVAKKELLEHAKVFDHFYGTPKVFVMDALKAGKCVLLAIDVQGKQKIDKNLSNKVQSASIFILPPSLKVLRERLEGRNTDTQEVIEKRIEVAQEEIKEAGSYAFTVMNQNLEQTVLEIEKFVGKFQKERS